VHRDQVEVEISRCILIGVIQGVRRAVHIPGGIAELLSPDDRRVGAILNCAPAAIWISRGLLKVAADCGGGGGLERSLPQLLSQRVAIARETVVIRGQSIIRMPLPASLSDKEVLLMKDMEYHCNVLHQSRRVRERRNEPSPG